MITEIVLVPIFGCVFSMFMGWVKKHNKEIYEMIKEDIREELKV